MEAVEQVIARATTEPLPATVDEQQNKYEDLFLRASDAIMLLDFETHEIVEANRRAVELYGYAHEELIGLSMLDLVPHEQHAAMLRNTRALGAGAGALKVAARTHIRKDGSQIQVRISAALITYGGRTVFQDIVRDETERVQIEESLRAQSLELSELNAQLQCEMAERTRIVEELRRLAQIDDLTQVANRRAFEIRLDQEWRRAVRGKGTICLFFVDLDHFKTINDTCGHSAGDEVLKAVAAELDSNCQRATDWRTKPFTKRNARDEIALSSLARQPPRRARLLLC